MFCFGCGPDSRLFQSLTGFFADMPENGKGGMKFARPSLLGTGAATEPLRLAELDAAIRPTTPEQYADIL
jgi:hypothetical protein